MQQISKFECASKHMVSCMKQNACIRARRPDRLPRGHIGNVQYATRDSYLTAVLESASCGDDDRFHVSLTKSNSTFEHATEAYVLMISTKRGCYAWKPQSITDTSILIAPFCPLLAPSSQSNQPQPWPCPPSSSALTRSVPRASKSASYPVSPPLLASP